MLDYQVLITTPDSWEYDAVTQLRYRLFLKEYDVPMEKILKADNEERSILITLARGEQIIGCGRLSPVGEEGQISHMAVDVPWQRTGYGSVIMKLLLERARKMELKKISLNARITAIGFYHKFGFTPVDNSIPSVLTGLPHVKMENVLK